MRINPTLRIFPECITFQSTAVLTQLLLYFMGKTLLSDGANVNTRCSRGRTALMSAAWAGRLQNVEVR